MKVRCLVVKILCVEDDPTQMTLITVMLESSGHEVFSARDSQSVIEQLAHVRPDLVIMDYLLPGADGVSITHYLKTSADYCDIPVLAVTANSGSRKLFVEAGAEGYICKPMRRAILLEMIDHLLWQKRTATPENG